MFFALRPQVAVLADNCKDLIRTFRTVKSRASEVVDVLDGWPINKEFFLSIRAEDPSDSVIRAARFIYLNKTSFNGLYRLNRAGEFNVPYGGRRPTRIVEGRLISECSASLRPVRLLTAPFNRVLRDTRTTDVVYLDPPYVVGDARSDFRGYTKDPFRWVDHGRLAEWASHHVEGGGRVIVSNSAHSEVLRLYPRHLFIQLKISRPCRIAGDESKRRSTTEALLVSRTFGYSRRHVVSHIRDRLRDGALLVT